ncbi:MAG: methyltransferase domain-containing protein [Clostridia bacterium]|nr:methyltransferase domain-containing protein [Clostridia bacterium]
MDATRRLAFLILKDVETEGAYSNILLNSRLKDPKGASPAAVRRLVRGVLQNRILLDAQIDRFLKKPGLKPKERVLLRMGFYQLLFQKDSVPAHAAVSETVALAKSFMRGREGFLNAVLRAFQRDGCCVVFPAEDGPGGPAGYLSVRYSVAPWIASLWLKSYGRDRTEAMLQASLEEPPLSLRVNPLKCPDGLSDLPKGSLEDSAAWREGLVSVQDESAQEAVRVLAPRSGQRVLDLCAAPGGKSCAMAELMENAGEVLSCDISENKLSLIEKEAERLGIAIIRTRQQDASLPPDEEDRDAFDAVLCDVPCSGLGVMRRKPEIRYNVREEGARALPEKQLAILRTGGACVKPGGSLLYSTCTVNPAENEAVVRAFLADGGFELLQEKQTFLGEGKRDGFYYGFMRKQIR